MVLFWRSPPNTIPDQPILTPPKSCHLWLRWSLLLALRPVGRGHSDWPVTTASPDVGDGPSLGSSSFWKITLQGTNISPPGEKENHLQNATFDGICSFPRGSFFLLVTLTQKKTCIFSATTKWEKFFVGASEPQPFLFVGVSNKSGTLPTEPTFFFSGWWFQPIWKILVKLGSSSPGTGENKKCLKPPPSFLIPWPAMNSDSLTPLEYTLITQRQPLRVEDSEVSGWFNIGLSLYGCVVF